MKLIARDPKDPSHCYCMFLAPTCDPEILERIINNRIAPITSVVKEVTVDKNVRANEYGSYLEIQVWFKATEPVTVSNDFELVTWVDP